MREYYTLEGDRLDKIVWDYYGALTPALLNEVYRANQNIGDYEQPFEAGIKILLPAIEVSDVEIINTIRLTT